LFTVRSSEKKFGPTYVLIIINSVVYAATAILSMNPLIIDDQILSLLGQWNVRVLSDGWYWQMFTSLFIHANLLHILGNMFFLLIFGIRAEDLFSDRQYLAIYFASGLVGNLLSLLMGPDVVSVGASGAIFGIFGASVIYMRKSVGQSIVGALIYALYLFIFNIGAGVNLLAHLGGLVTGLLIGYSLAKRHRHTQQAYGYRYTVNY
jgi:rhomboid protease GluP